MKNTKNCFQRNRKELHSIITISNGFSMKARWKYSSIRHNSIVTEKNQIVNLLLLILHLNSNNVWNKNTFITESFINYILK